MDADAMKEALRAYILKEFLPGEDPAQLTDSVPLITSGVLDSLATLKLVAFLEESFGIEFAAHEVGVEHLNTISDMVSFVQSKGGHR